MSECALSVEQEIKGKAGARETWPQEKARQNFISPLARRRGHVTLFCLHSHSRGLRWRVLAHRFYQSKALPPDSGQSSSSRLHPSVSKSNRSSCPACTEGAAAALGCSRLSLVGFHTKLTPRRCRAPSWSWPSTPAFPPPMARVPRVNQSNSRRQY